MIIAISPYDLTRDSPALLAGALLADQIVTLLPAPLEGATPEAIHDAVEKHPAFLRYIEASRWLSPLWHEGVLIPGPLSTQGPHAAILDDARAISSRVLSDPSLESLRRLVDPSVFQSTDAYVGGIARDLLLGGVSPSFVVTVGAAIDRFAARYRLPSFKSETASRVGSAERRAARPFLRLSLPVPRVAVGEDLVLLRHDLAAPLRAVRDRLTRCLEAPDADDERAMRSTIAEIEDAFGRHHPEGARTVVLSFTQQPSDRALRIAGVASRSVVASARKPGRTQTAPPPSTSEALDLPQCIVVNARFANIDARTSG